MRGFRVLVVAAGVCLAATGLAAADTGATATLSSHRAGAHNVGVGVTFSALLQCGRPRGALTVTLAGPVPKHIAASSVTLGGAPVGSVDVSGRTVTVKAAAGGTTCYSMRIADETLTFAPSAGLANPAKRGAYSIRLVLGATTYVAPFRITG